MRPARFSARRAQFIHGDGVRVKRTKADKLGRPSAVENQYARRRTDQLARAGYAGRIFPFASRRDAHWPQNLEERVRRHRGRSYLVERRRKLRVARDRPFYLVSSRRAWPFRGKFPEADPLCGATRREAARRVARSGRCRLSLALADRIPGGGIER